MLKEASRVPWLEGFPKAGIFFQRYVAAASAFAFPAPQHLRSLKWHYTCDSFQIIRKFALSYVEHCSMDSLLPVLPSGKELHRPIPLSHYTWKLLPCFLSLLYAKLKLFISFIYYFHWLSSNRNSNRIWVACCECCKKWGCLPCWKRVSLPSACWMKRILKTKRWAEAKKMLRA